MKKRLVGFLPIVLLVFPLSAYPGVPFEEVKGYLNRVLDILRDPALRGEAEKKVKKEKISATLLFDSSFEPGTCNQVFFSFIPP